MNEIILAMSAAAAVVKIGLDIVKAANSEGREPTADEISQVKAAQKAAEDAWAAAK